MKADQTAFWTGGADSCNDPAFIGDRNYVYGINGVHRGGKFRTRPGFNELIEPPASLQGVQTDARSPQGLTIFTPQGGVAHLVMAHGGKIYTSPYPFTEPFTELAGIQFFGFADRIIFTTCVRSQQTLSDGSLQLFDEPFDILLMQDGVSRPAYWDGMHAVHTPDVPVGQAAIWNSNRYWVGDTHKLHAGDFGDPLGFNEEKITAIGGFYVLPDEITGIGETPDQKALLVWTPMTTSTFQSSILDRTQWPQTPGFQSLLFKNIGCVGPKAWTNQYGVTWWESHGGTIALDTALQTYRTRRIRYADNGVKRSKVRMHGNRSRICAGQFENFLFFSWPSANVWNSHTGVIDQESVQTTVGEQAQVGSSWAGVWTGIRPVEWVTAVIEGEMRCLVLSRDYATGSDYRIGIWEAFCKERNDVQLDGTVKRITVGIELKQMAFSKDPKKIQAIELGMSELRNRVDLRISFNGRRTAFRRIDNKTIQATQVDPDMDEDDFINYRPQQRVVRSISILRGDRSQTSVQSTFIDTIDLGFGVYVEWDGEAALEDARCFYEDQPETTLGQVGPIEDKARLVGWDNDEIFSPVNPLPVTPIRTKSSIVESISQRFIEPQYSSR